MHHHEKYDGTGYPDKQKQDEIQTISKIMSVIDVYDALVNDRVYKKAMPYEEAEAYIISQNEIAFAPKIINIFILVKEEFREINEKYKDKIEE
jgi:putative two-component system response regulator